MKKIIIIIFISFIMFVNSKYVLAHKVNVYGYAENGKVFVEAYFVDGTKAKNSLVEVFDAKTSKLLLVGKTNEKGEFSFKIPKLTSLKLVLTASMGHKNDYVITEEEIKDALKNISEKKVDNDEKSIHDNSVRNWCQQISLREIETIVDKVVERKLQPLKNILLKIEHSTHKPTTTEIIGGIGYIMGLMGIIMYFKNRKK